jgi:hypothetical protein
MGRENTRNMTENTLIMRALDTMMKMDMKRPQILELWKSTIIWIKKMAVMELDALMCLVVPHNPMSRLENAVPSVRVV